MKLVFIYGPPATGKLTVAKELAATLGFKLFHNHASIDVVEPIFKFGSEPFHRLVGKIRLDIIEEAAREQISGLIFTFVYAHPEDQAFVDKISQAVEKHGGQMCFVQLYCDIAILEERVIAESRRNHGKIVTNETLKEVMDKHDLFSTVPERESLSIDNSQLSPQEVVQRIIAHYHLSAA